MIGALRHVRGRRAALRAAIDTDAAFDQWEESCVPSYVHPNPFAAGVSWLRLFRAADLMRRSGCAAGRVLDFGASVGELGHLLGADVEYEFVEQDDAAAGVLSDQLPGARRYRLGDAPRGAYDAVFAIDALEHNDDFAGLLADLAALLAPRGVLILSGPTENALYRLGRRIAGFQGDYHVTTIHQIEDAAAERMTRVAAAVVPFGVPLFRLSAWRRRDPERPGPPRDQPAAG